MRLGRNVRQLLQGPAPGNALWIEGRAQRALPLQQRPQAQALLPERLRLNDGEAGPAGTRGAAQP